jgi:hypothetical protein
VSVVQVPGPFGPLPEDATDVVSLCTAARDGMFAMLIESMVAEKTDHLEALAIRAAHSPRFAVKDLLNHPRGQEVAERAVEHLLDHGPPAEFRPPFRFVPGQLTDVRLNRLVLLNDHRLVRSSTDDALRLIGAWPVGWARYADHTARYVLTQTVTGLAAEVFWTLVADAGADATPAGVAGTGMTVADAIAVAQAIDR